MKWVTRLLAPLAIVAVLAACGSSSHSASSSTTTPPASSSPATTANTPSSTSPATTPPSSGSTTPATTPVTSTPECATTQLGGGIGSPDGTAGTIFYQLTLTNRGSTVCTVQGYPGVSFVTGSTGQQVGAPAARETGPAAVIALAPGQSASSTLGIVEAGNFGPACQITGVLGLRVYPPNNTTALFVAHTDQGCANSGDVTLNVRPLIAS